MTLDTAQPPPIGRYPEGSNLETFRGGYHCHKLIFEFRHPSLEVKKPVSCNCTLCTRCAAVNIFGQSKFFRLGNDSASWDELSRYKSKTKPITHHFCPDCVSWLFWSGVGLVDVNVCMLDGIEVEKLSIDYYDGRKNESS